MSIFISLPYIGFYSYNETVSKHTKRNFSCPRSFEDNALPKTAIKMMNELNKSFKPQRSRRSQRYFSLNVISAKAGIHTDITTIPWIPACAEMTTWEKEYAKITPITKYESGRDS
jgi:hypothetical protein